MSRSPRFAVLLVAGLASIAVAPIAHGAVIVATDFQSGASPFTPTYTVSSTDLVNGLAPSAQAGNFQQESSAGTVILTNGVGTGTIDRGLAQAPRNAQFATAGNTGGTSLTYTLAQASNLTSVVVYGGWQDNGRDQQRYDLFYSTAVDPATFIPLTSVNFNPMGISGGIPVATRVTISDDAGTLAGNVAALRFDFPAVENGYAGYSEVDVFGSPVPEPASLGLIGFAALGLLGRRRRA